MMRYAILENQILENHLTHVMKNAVDRAKAANALTHLSMRAVLRVCLSIPALCYGTLLGSTRLVIRIYRGHHQKFAI